MDKDFDLSQLFETDNVTITQLDNLPTQDLININVKSDTDGRFDSVNVVTDLSLLKAQRIPRNTRKQNSWAMSCFEDWAQWRNKQSEFLLGDRGAVPVDIAAQSLVSLDYWLSRFIVECRREDVQNYPPNTLYNITTSIQRSLREDHGRFGYTGRE
ncbi:uncharacterized protein LOC132728414 [Ruditapes philippinarum]|uniref:uncharacterized protein LOC132728414 n=1 Tax=Ruditapes philippinarum TaxID=129788 RepID=UPI00295AFFD6|nr:uncharacterized protein LOC132728414 [Ruditapes philippinarum]